MENNKKNWCTARALWYALVAIFILGQTFVSAQELEIDQAKKLVELDQKKKAISVLQTAIGKYPQDASLRYYLGVTQLKNKEAKEALISFDDGIQLNDKEALNYAGKGHYYASNSENQEAQIWIDKALSISKSKNAKVLKAVAEAKLSLSNKGDDVITLLEKALAIDNRDFETRILLGDAYLAVKNDGGKAVTQYEYAASLNPKNALPYYKIGLVFIRSGNLNVAQETLSKAISIDTEYTLAYKELGELFYLKKDGVNAAKAYEKYLSLTENPEPGKVQYAFFLFMAKDFVKANDVFHQLTKRGDVSPVTWRFYAYALFEAGKFDESQSAFATFFEKVKADQVVAMDYAYFAKLLIKRNQDSLALENIAKSLLLEKKQQELTQLQAETLFKLKKYNETIASYKNLYSIRQKLLSQDWYTLGRSYYFLKQYEQADSSFLQLIQQQPTMQVGYLWEARAKSNLDPESESGLAKPYYEKVIELNMNTPDKYKNELVEAYSYLGYYHYLKQDLKTSKSFWEKVLALNPGHAKAKEALLAMH